MAKQLDIVIQNLISLAGQLQNMEPEQLAKIDVRQLDKLAIELDEMVEYALDCDDDCPTSFDCLSDEQQAELGRRPTDE